MFVVRRQHFLAEVISERAHKCGEVTKYNSAKFCVRGKVGVMEWSNLHKTFTQETGVCVPRETKSQLSQLLTVIQYICRFYN